jgi:type II secretory pathway predicted ATPase ExeA
MAETGAVSPARVFARPTADQIWLGPAQQAVLSQLSRAARTRLLVGPPSSGKTTLLNHVAAKLGEKYVVLPCRGPKEDSIGVLASLLLDAGLAPWELSEIEQRNLFSVFVHQRRSQGRRIMLVLDDAHHFAPPAWEEIERLLSFKVDRKPALELLLAGPPSLAARIDLRRSAHEPMEVCVQVLEPASQDELASYIEWRLARFEMTDLVTPGASRLIARMSGGRYSAVDVLCQMALLLLRRTGVDRVDERVAQQAIAALVTKHNSKPAIVEKTDMTPPVEVLPQGFVVVSRDGQVIDRFVLAERTLIGRSEHNDICLASPYLSRHHAAIVGTPEGYYVLNLNSANGLSVNGRRLDRARLCDDDVLTMGPFRLKVQIPDRVSQRSPLPESDSLADTAILPPLEEPQAPSAMRRVK